MVEENARPLADCVITLLMLFDPAELYVGGSILDVYGRMAQTVTDRVQRLGPHYARIPVRMEPAPETALKRGIVEMLIERWEL